MAKNICVLCGQSVPFFDRSGLTIGGTRQTICPGCAQIYQNALPADREALREQALASPHLVDREMVLDALDAAPSTQSGEASQTIAKKCSACGGTLEPARKNAFAAGLPSFACSMSQYDLDVYCCSLCGKVEFYHSAFRPARTVRQPDQPPAVTCPVCGAKHSRLLPCPNCGQEKEHVTISETRSEKKGVKPPWER